MMIKGKSESCVDHVAFRGLVRCGYKLGIIATKQEWLADPSLVLQRCLQIDSEMLTNWCLHSGGTRTDILIVGGCAFSAIMMFQRVNGCGRGCERMVVASSKLRDAGQS